MQTFRIISSAILVVALSLISSVSDAATLLFSDGFETGNFTKWDDNHGVKIVTSPVHDGSRSMAYCYGCSGFGGGGNTVRSFANRKRVYVSFYWYFPTGYYFNWRVGGHPFRLKTNRNGQLDTEFQSNLNMVIFSNCTAGSCTTETLFNNVPTALAAQTNHWYHMEIDAQMNTNGQSDGFLKVWVDGVQKLNSTGRRFSNFDEFWNELWITSNDDNCQGGASACTLYVDDVEIWDSPPTTADRPPPPVLRVQ